MFQGPTNKKLNLITFKHFHTENRILKSECWVESEKFRHLKITHRKWNIKVKRHCHFVDRTRRTRMQLWASFELFKMCSFDSILFLLKNFPTFPIFLHNHFGSRWTDTELFSCQDAWHRILAYHFNEFSSNVIGNFVVLVNICHFYFAYLLSRISSSWHLNEEIYIFCFTNHIAPTLTIIQSVFQGLFKIKSHCILYLHHFI